jgi:hypothetical protein
MSDPKSSYGEPVDEPKDAAHDDVVGRAHEGLANAEAARQGTAPAEEAPAAEPAPVFEQTVDEQPTAPETTAAATPVEPAAAPVEPLDEPARTADAVVVEEEPAAAAPATTPWYEREDEDEARWAAYAASADTATATPAADETPTVAAAPVRTAEPAAVAAGAGFGAVGQPIFVQAPEAPSPRGNRGAAGAIGLLAALAFAVLYLAATLGIGLLYGDFAVADLVDATVDVVTTAAMWVPVVVFYIAFWFLGAIINRGRWGHWVVWGLIVGVAAWGGHILGALFQAPFWMLTARQGVDLVESQVLAPLAIVAFVLGRELTIWFGAWVAARGKRVTEINLEAQREYERTLEAGPQLHQ